MRTAPLPRELTAFLFEREMRATRLVLQYTVLIFIVIPILSLLYFWAITARFLGHRPHWVAGQALGADAAVRAWTRFNLWLVGWLSRPLRIYLSRFHPRVADWVERRLWL